MARERFQRILGWIDDRVHENYPDDCDKLFLLREGKMVVGNLNLDLIENCSNPFFLPLPFIADFYMAHSQVRWPDCARLVLGV